MFLKNTRMRELKNLRDVLCIIMTMSFVISAQTEECPSCKDSSPTQVQQVAGPDLSDRLQDLQQTVALQERQMRLLQKRLDLQESRMTQMQMLVDEDGDESVSSEDAKAMPDMLLVLSLILKMDEVKERSWRLEDDLKNEKKSRRDLELLMNGTRLEILRNYRSLKQHVQQLVPTFSNSSIKNSTFLDTDFDNFTKQLELRMDALEAVTNSAILNASCSYQSGDLQSSLASRSGKRAPSVTGRPEELINTPLHLALMNNYAPDIVRSLIEKSTDVSVPNSDGNTALHFALMNKFDPEIVQLLLEKGANVSFVNKKYISPLHYALMNDYDADIIRVMIERAE